LSLYNRARRQRLRAFDTRPDTYAGPHHTWRWWNVHLLADEHELLQRYDVSPEECTQVDLFWRTDQDVHFVRIRAGADAPALNYEVRELRLLEIVIEVPELTITRMVVDRALATAYLLGLPGSRARRGYPRGGLLPAPKPERVARIYADAIQPIQQEEAAAEDNSDRESPAPVEEAPTPEPVVEPA